MAPPLDGRHSRPIVLLSGGGGGARLAAALAPEMVDRDLVVVANTGDDFEHLGLVICPDIDSLLYAVTGTMDTARGWGRSDESWRVLDTIRTLAGPDWFQLGDQDLALHLIRKQLLDEGLSLAACTAVLARRFGVSEAFRLIPASDQPIRTCVQTDEGEMAFQDYFVAHRSQPKLTGIRYGGIEAASISPPLAQVLSGGIPLDIVLGPSNPFLSLAPILRIPGMLAALQSSARRVVAVSPIIAGQALKGPAAKIMAELGLEVSAAGWTRLMSEQYPNLVDIWVWDSADEGDMAPLRQLGLDVRCTGTILRERSQQQRFVRWLLHETLADD